MLKKYELTQPNQVSIDVSAVALVGNRELAAAVLEPLLQHENYGFNKLHLDVLKLDRLTEKYATQSITKKGTSSNNVTPLHLACINPNTKVLETLLN